MSLKYREVVDYLTTGLSGLGYDPLPAFSPGPVSNQNALTISSGAILFINVGGGAGMSTELLYESPFIAIRCVGKAGDFNWAEKFADDVDKLLLRFPSNTKAGDTRVAGIFRAGGRPEMVTWDTNERYHIQCTYIAESASGIDA